MPDLVIAGLGAALVLVDVFRTVLWSGRGAGPLTTVVTAVGRRASSRLEGRPVARSAVGPAAIVATDGHRVEPSSTSRGTLGVETLRAAGIPLRASAPSPSSTAR